MGAQETTLQARRRIEEVLELARNSVEPARLPHLEAYLEIYVQNLPERVLARTTPSSLLAFLMERVRFLDEDLDRPVKVQVSRPGTSVPLLRAGVTVVETRVPDATFLVRTLKEFFRRRDAQIDLVVHPLVGVEVENGRVARIDPRGERGKILSHVYLHVTRIAEEDFETVRTSLEYRLRAVLRVNADFQGSLARLAKVRESLVALGKARRTSAEEAAEAVELVDWIANQNFIFLGYAHCTLGGGRPRMDDLLGLLTIDGEKELLELAGVIAAGRLERDEIVSFYRTDIVSVVKAESQIRYVGFKAYDEEGASAGEHVFLGILSSNSRGERNSRIPIIAKRMREVLDSMQLHRGSYAFRKMFAILNSIPNEDLFYSTPDEIRDLARFIREAEGADHTRVRIFRRSPGRRIATVCVMPRAGFSEALRERVQETICRFLEVPQLRNYIRESDDEGPMRLHFYVSRYRDGVTDADLQELESRVALVLETWEEKLQRLLEHPSDPSVRLGPEVWEAYSRAFGPAYRESHSPEEAIRDIAHLERLYADDQSQVRMAVSDTGEEARTLLTIYSGVNLILNDVVPVLEMMALRAKGRLSDRVVPTGRPPAFVTVFEVVGADSRRVDHPGTIEHLTKILRLVLSGRLPPDPLLALAVLAGLDGREIALFITYRNYFLQLFSGSAAHSIDDALVRHPRLVQIFAAYFEAKFNPDLSGTPAGRLAGRLGELERTFYEELQQVHLLQEDVIFRKLRSLFAATIRTNYFRPDAGDVISIKVASTEVEDMPRPRPLFEIYVHGPYVDGVHLRGGKVARGGIRHSDRVDDFRSEVLGLMKTQMTKNSVIVPVGSKGGFVTHRVYEDRTWAEAELVAQYQNFISGLLDVTDNIVGDRIVPPPRVLRYDPDDPYLVVAADKGTAKLSDTANAISQKFGFWLGDAFASGGSAGYDHKAMGITAKGAWECVKRHFRELDVDPEKETIRAAGVGDMSGDVFGNGMLRSRTMKLVAAFNHRHIFLDPDPDPEASFAERKRLYDLPRSSWTDYQRPVLSRGGAIFERNAKSVELSPEARALLGAGDGTLSGPEIVRRILALDVDFLWFGGIGTYVKGSDETHASVADKVNDDYRIDARDLRARVIGEGANLAMTSRGRTEFNLLGGRSNTDALDNSAGVDCSDHEVNLKILFGQLLASGRLTLGARDRLLRELEPEVGAMCLSTNYLQSALVTLDQLRSRTDGESFVELVAALEKWPGFHRPTSSVPSDDTLRQWAATGRGLPRNVLADLAAHTKNSLFQSLLESSVLDLPWFTATLYEYFPRRVVELASDEILRHPLRREILATVLANRLVNQAGSAYLVGRAREARSNDPEQVARYFLADALIGGPSLRRQVHALDGRVPSALQYEALLALESAIIALARWINWNQNEWIPGAETIEEVRPGCLAAAAALEACAAEAERAETMAHRTRLVEAGVPAALAGAISSLPFLGRALHVVGARRESSADVAEAARLYYAVGQSLHLDVLRVVLDRPPPADPSERRFHAILQRKTSDLRTRLLRRFLASTRPTEALERFTRSHAAAIDQLGAGLRIVARSDSRALIPVFLVLDEYAKMYAATASP